MNAAEFSTEPVDKFVDEVPDGMFFGFQQPFCVKSIKI